MCDAPPFVVLSGIAAVILHEEVMLSIQIVTGDLQSFTEPLEVDDLPFSEEAQGSEDFGVIRHVDEVFVGGAGFLFCCTFVSVTCYVKSLSRVSILFLSIEFKFD